MEKHTTACQQYQGTDCVCSLTPMTPTWKEEIFSIIGKLDNGSHSSNQLQGADEELTLLIEKTLEQQRKELVRKIERLTIYTNGGRNKIDLQDLLVLLDSEDPNKSIIDISPKGHRHSGEM